MKKVLSIFAALLLLSLAACSRQSRPPAPAGAPSGLTMLEEGVWPDNAYTEGLPIPPGTVTWAALDTEQGYCSVSLTGMDEGACSGYMERLKQEGFAVVESVSEEIGGEGAVSIGTLLSDGEKWLSISYIEDSLGIYISLEEGGEGPSK